MAPKPSGSDRIKPGFGSRARAPDDGLRDEAIQETFLRPSIASLALAAGCKRIAIDLIFGNRLCLGYHQSPESAEMTAPVNVSTPARILRALKRAPALQRDEIIASTYLGRKVFWKTRFFDVADIYQDPIRQFSFTLRGWHRFSRLDHPIYGHIDIDRHPETRSMRRGRRVDLYGTIANVDTVLGITLLLEGFDILPLTLFDRIVQREDSRI